MKKRFWIVPSIVFLTVLLLMKSLWRGGCADGWQSPSIGIRGACSHHGGVGSGGGISFIIALALAGYSFYRLDKAEAQKNRRLYHLSMEWLRLDLTSAPFYPQEYYSIKGNVLSYTYLTSMGSEAESLSASISDKDVTMIEKLARALATQSHASDILVLDGLDVHLTMNIGEPVTFQALQISDISSLGSSAVCLIETLDKHLHPNA